MLRCIRQAKMKSLCIYLKNEFFLHLPIIFNDILTKANVVSLANQNYMIATGYLELKFAIFFLANI